MIPVERHAPADRLRDAGDGCEDQAAKLDEVRPGEYSGVYVLPQGDWIDTQQPLVAQLRLGNMFFHGEGVPANNVQAYIVLKMAAVNGSDEAMDSADQVAERMQREELQAASQVLGQIFRSYLLELQHIDSGAPSGFSPAPSAPGTSIGPQAPAFVP